MNSSIAYSNLRAEMARHHISVQDIAAAINTNRDTAGRKLSGKSQFSLPEAFKIVRTFFPSMEIGYLFSELVVPSGKDTKS